LHIYIYESGINGVVASVPTYQRPRKREMTVVDRLLALNASTRPGLSEKDFRKLFAKCRCGLVMTQRVFKRHACVEIVYDGDDSDSSSGPPSPSPQVIDLTSDSDDIAI
jgi:hypothetical protein